MSKIGYRPQAYFTYNQQSTNTNQELTDSLLIASQDSKKISFNLSPVKGKKGGAKRNSFAKAKIVLGRSMTPLKYVRKLQDSNTCSYWASKAKSQAKPLIKSNKIQSEYSEWTDKQITQGIIYDSSIRRKIQTSQKQRSDSVEITKLPVATTALNETNWNPLQVNIKKIRRLTGQLGSETTFPKSIDAEQLPEIGNYSNRVRTAQKIPRQRPISININPRKQFTQTNPSTVNTGQQVQEATSKSEFESNLVPKQQDSVNILSAYDNPAFFNIFIEQRHADMLQKRNLDQESRLEVIYRILKDQLKRAKLDLLEIKKDKKNERIMAEKIKRRMQQSAQNKTIKVVKTDQKKQGEEVYKLQSDLPKDFRRVANYLLHTEVRRHNRYCPCCRNYDEGNDLNPNQMGEFLEYIKNLHYNLTGHPKRVKKFKPANQTLEYDSVSDVTDLDEQGILTTSMHKLDQFDQKKLKRYVAEMRSLQKYEPPKHDCINAIKKQQKNYQARQLMEMELKVKQKELEFSDKECSAHQFSQRSKSLQADSVAQLELDLQIDLIDKKTKFQNIDFYELGSAKNPVTITSSIIGFKQTEDRAVGTDQPRKMLATTDWFYSQINRKLIRDYFETKNISTVDIDQKFEQHELIFQTENVLDTIQVCQASMTLDPLNPQDPILSNVEVKVLSQPEIKILINMLKDKTDCFETVLNLKQIHSQAITTAKYLTQQLIEGKVPIQQLLEKYDQVDKESCLFLLHRCDKLYRATDDVKRVMLLMINFQYAKDRLTRTKVQTDQMLHRLRGLISQFSTEHNIYPKDFQYDGKKLNAFVECLLGGVEIQAEWNAFDRQMRSMLKDKPVVDQVVEIKQSPKKEDFIQKVKREHLGEQQLGVQYTSVYNKNTGKLKTKAQLVEM